MLVSRRAKSLANNKRNIRHFLPSDQAMSGDIPWNQSGVPTAEVVVALPHQLEVALVWDPSKITESQVYIYMYIIGMQQGNNAKTTPGKPPFQNMGMVYINWLIL